MALTQLSNSMKILFIAGFGPVTDDLSLSRKLYSEDLEIEFKEYEGGICTVRMLMVAKGLPYGHFHWQQKAVLEERFGRMISPDHRRGWSLK